MFSFSTPSRLLLSLLLFLSLHSLVVSTEIQKQCRSAANQAGEGFDVVTQQRKGTHPVDDNGICVLHPNPLQGNMLHKVPSSEVDWSAFNQCSLHDSQHSTISSLLRQHTDEESNDWKEGLYWETLSLDVGGTRSSVYDFASARTKEDCYTFSSHWVSCILYSYRVSDNPTLSYEFIRDLQKLPSSYNQSTRAQYNRIIRIYGTHYIRQVYLGGLFRRVTAIRICLATLNGFSSSEVHNCLSLGLNISLGMIKLPANQKTCEKVLQNKDFATSFSSGLYEHYTEVVGGKGWTGESEGYQNWLKTLKDHPDAVMYSLRPLYELVPDSTKKQGLKSAIEQYLKDHAIKSSTTQPSCGRSDPNLDSSCCPKQAWRGKLVVTIVRAWGLNGDSWGNTDGYVKMWYGSIYYKTHVVKSNDPHWNSGYYLGTVDTHQSLKIEVWDKDQVRDGRLGSCTRNLRQGTHRYHCRVGRGGVEILYTLTCDRHLTGDKCNQYKPSPY